MASFPVLAWVLSGIQVESRLCPTQNHSHGSTRVRSVSHPARRMRPFGACPTFQVLQEAGTHFISSRNVSELMIKWTIPIISPLCCSVRTVPPAPHYLRVKRFAHPESVSVEWFSKLTLRWVESVCMETCHVSLLIASITPWFFLIGS